MYPSGMNLLPKSPRLAQASTIKFPHTAIQITVHNQPSQPPTFKPVTFLNDASRTQPTPMSKKKPPTLQNSVPLPIPHIPKSCSIADQKNAPMTPPTRPMRNENGLAPMPMKEPLKIWCHRLPQQSVNDVESQGESKRGGHCVGRCCRIGMQIIVRISYPACMAAQTPTSAAIVIKVD